MPYCTVEEVKRNLRLPDDYVDSDSEIEATIDDAEAWINGELTIAGISNPLADPVPDLINRAASYYAAYFFRRRADPPVSEEQLLELAQQFLNKYLLANGASVTPGTAPTIPLTYGRGDAV